MATLYLIHGFIGSGKTTFSKKLAIQENAVRFTPDEWMCHFYSSNPPQESFSHYNRRIKDMIWFMAVEFLKRGQNVILDDGFWQRSGRDSYKKRAENLGVQCVLYAADSDYETCKERALKRTADMPSGELYIDENAIQLFWTNFEPVQPDEGALKAS